MASALAIGDPDLTLAVWDRRLHAGAATAGLSVALPASQLASWGQDIALVAPQLAA